MTSLSRVLGLVRDMMTAGLLGLTATASAFFFAFTIPNLFRRLLGEGALTAVFIPVFTDELAAAGKAGAFRFTNTVLSWLTVVLVLLVVLTGAAFGLGWWWLESIAEEGAVDCRFEQWRLGCQLSVLLMPYMLFICLSAVFGAALNVLERFAVSALSPVLLNLAMLTVLLVAGILFEVPLEQLVLYLCTGVLLGGILQLLLPLVALLRLGWRPAIDFSRSTRLLQLVRLFLPGVVGAAVAQVNVLISRVLAFQLNASAVAALFYANRLVELPLGVFTIAITTVLFPRLTRLVADGENTGLQDLYTQGMRWILIITVPAMVGLVVLREPILSLLFEWQSFGPDDVAETSPLLVIYAFALPFYSMSTLASRGFYSLQDTRTPVRVAIVAFVVNLFCSLALMYWMGTIGLALANLVAAVVQCILLHYALIVQGGELRVKWSELAIGQIAVAALVMGAFAWAGSVVIPNLMAEGKGAQFTVVAVVIPLAAALYFGLFSITHRQSNPLGKL